MSSANPQPSTRRCQVIVAGFGPVGRCVAQRLDADGMGMTIIELNEKTVDRQASIGRTIVFGDVRDPQTLLAAGLLEADALILTIPDEEAVLEACRTARGMHPEIFIAARTNYLSRGMIAHQAGADCVVVEEVVTAEAMEKAVVRHLLTPAEDGKP